MKNEQSEFLSVENSQENEGLTTQNERKTSENEDPENHIAIKPIENIKFARQNLRKPQGNDGARSRFARKPKENEAFGVPKASFLCFSFDYE